VTDDGAPVIVTSHGIVRLPAWGLDVDVDVDGRVAATEVVASSTTSALATAYRRNGMTDPLLGSGDPSTARLLPAAARR
jgi:hypothetical protein